MQVSTGYIWIDHIQKINILGYCIQILYTKDYNYTLSGGGVKRESLVPANWEITHCTLHSTYITLDNI